MDTATVRFAPSCDCVIRLGIWGKKINDGAERIERFLRGIWGALTAAINASIMQGKQVDPNVTIIQERVMITRSFISAFRALPELFKLITLKTFWDLDANGDRKWVGSDKKSTWKDGARSWTIAAIDTMVAVAHVLCFPSLMHRLEAVDLGKHANHFGTAICALFAGATLMYLVDSLRAIMEVKKDQLSELPAKITDFIASLGDLFALPWDLGYYYKSPQLSLVGGILLSFSSFVWYVNEAVSFEP